MLGTEGARRFSFALRNVGTAPCRAAQVLDGARPVAALGSRRRRTRSRRGAASRTRSTSAWSAGTKTGRAGAAEVQRRRRRGRPRRQQRRGSAPMVVRPGDTTRASRRGGHVPRQRHAPAPARVSPSGHCASRTCRSRCGAAASECRWLGSSRGDLRTLDEGDGGKCDEPVWVTVEGTEQWRLRLRERLPKGRYTLRSRAVLANGVAEGRFTRGDKNLVRVPRALDGCRGRARPRGPDARYVRPSMWASIRRALAALTLLLLFPAAASAGPLDDPADQWLPRSDGASWTYAWSNSDLPAGAAQGALRHDGALGHVLPADLDGDRPAGDRDRLGRHDRLPAHGHGPGQHELPEHAAAAALPDPVRGRHGLRELAVGRLVPGHLGHALAGLRRADAAGHALELARRRVQRRRLEQPLRRARRRSRSRRSRWASTPRGSTPRSPRRARSATRSGR